MSDKYPILGLLQNPWAHDSKKVQEFMGLGYEQRLRWIMTNMPTSPTGWRLRRSLGDHLFYRMIWDNGDPTVSHFPGYQAKADPSHVARVITHYKPTLIICYGKTAEAAMEGQKFSGAVVYACHPTYRHRITIPQLAEAAQVVRDWLKYKGYKLPKFKLPEPL